MKEKKKVSTVEHLSEKVTGAIGSTTSIICHTLFFIFIFALYLFGIKLDSILLILTTVVSLEAIYLSIFIQMSVNKAAASLEEVEEDIDEIQEDVSGIEKDIDEIQEDVSGIEKDIDEIQEDIDEDDKTDEKRDISLDAIQGTLMQLMKEIEALKSQKK